MKKLITILLMIFPLAIFAQTQSSSNEQKKEVKQVEKAEIDSRVESMQDIRSNDTNSNSGVSLEQLDASIKELEEKIETNKNNPDFALEAYQRRLEIQKKRREELAEK